MEFRRRAITVGITFFLAMATGHLMQNADQIAAMLRGQPMHVTAELTQVEPTMAVLTPVAASTIAGLPGVAAKTPAALADGLSRPLPDLPAVEPAAFDNGTFLAKRIRLLGDGGMSPGVAPETGNEIYGFRCDQSELRVTAQPQAMLHVVLSAPCRVNAHVVFHHSGLSFAMMTDARGVAEVSVPALSRDGAVTAIVAGDAPLSGRDTVRDLDGLTRIALQAGRVPGLHLRAANEQDGQLTALGDPGLADPLLAEVYSAPKDSRLSGPKLEATAMKSNCGRTIAARSFRSANGATPESTLIRIAMPGCDRLDDMVVMPLAAFGADRIAASN